MEHNKKRLLICSIVVLNIVLIGLYIFYAISQSSIAETNKKDKAAKVEFINALKFRETYYGDVFPDNSLRSFDGSELSVAASNKNFKFLTVTLLAPGTDFKVNIKFFDELYNLKKMINRQDEILFTVLLLNADIQQSDLPLLKKLKEKFSIDIASLKIAPADSLYLLKNLGCGSYVLLLDKNNVVRFVNSGLSNNELSGIINNEIDRKE